MCREGKMASGCLIALILFMAMCTEIILLLFNN